MSDGYSRRELLGRRFLGNLLERVGKKLDDLAPGDQGCSPVDYAPACQSPRYRQAFPVLRPPGAVDEETFLDQCTRCEACIEACPHQAIVHAPPRFRRAAGTPMIDPVQQPCWMCHDFPCITACEPGVLRRELPVKMATVQIERVYCLAYQGSFCSVCVEQCPVEGAIEVTGGKPRIVDDVCTGCGVCQYVCPAPQNAVLLMPLAARPTPPKSSADETGP